MARKKKSSAKKRLRRFQTFRVTDDERQILQSLGQESDGTDRYHALMGLVSIISKMKIQPVKRRSVIRLGLPVELDAVLDQRFAETLDVCDNEEDPPTKKEMLLMAAQKYLDRKNKK